MASRNIKDCDIRLQNLWVIASTEWVHPCKVFLTCTHRSNEEQAKLYAIGRTVPGKIVTYARPGKSKHNLKPALAFDIAFLNPGGSLNWDTLLFKKFADLVKSIDSGVVWGGDFRSFKDRPHFEIPKRTYVATENL